MFSVLNIRHEEWDERAPDQMIQRRFLAMHIERVHGPTPDACDADGVALMYAKRTTPGHKRSTSEACRHSYVDLRQQHLSTSLNIDHLLATPEAARFAFAFSAAGHSLTRELREQICVLLSSHTSHADSAELQDHRGRPDREGFHRHCAVQDSAQDADRRSIWLSDVSNS